MCEELTWQMNKQSAPMGYQHEGPEAQVQSQDFSGFGIGVRGSPAEVRGSGETWDQHELGMAEGCPQCPIVLHTASIRKI